MQPLWNADEVASATNGRWIVNPESNWSPIRVSYDISGKLTGHLVIGKTAKSWGPNASDSSQFLAQILNKGAAGIVLEESQAVAAYQVPANFPILLVPNTRYALKRLAQAARQRFAGNVIAVTGTVGKTTSREMLVHVFARQGGASGTLGNNNNLAGVHRTLASLPRDERAGVLEMGFGLPLDGLHQASLVAQPHVALFTFLSIAHLDVFSDQQLATKSPLRLLAEHKAQIFDGLAPNGTVVLRHEIPELEFLKKIAQQRAAHVWTFGETPDADAVLESCHLATDRTQIRARIHGRPVEYELRIPGRHMALNSLGVLLAVVGAGGDLQQAGRDLQDFAPASHRLNVLTAGGCRVAQRTTAEVTTPPSITKLRPTARWQRLIGSPCGAEMVSGRKWCQGARCRATRQRSCSSRYV